LSFTPTVEHDPLDAKPVFGAIYPLLMLQKQLNLQNGMSEEAKIFERAQQQVEQLATTPPATFPDVLLRVDMLLRVVQDASSQDPAPLLPQWFERNRKYDSSGQL
ncbi:MAG: hypothetical protein KDE53_00255, partial [Caldilineaceae bacterium]|nr:hypothetical protein [Caldilineaceae bacterium]